MDTGAALLRDWIDRRGYNQAEAARFLNLSEPYLSMVLSGTRMPGRDRAVAIERKTGIPVAAWSLSHSDNSDVETTAADRQRTA